MKINLLKCGKAILTIILAFSVLAASLFTGAFVVSAGTVTSVWDGSSDTEFAVADETAEAGTATNPYIISTAAELYGMVSSSGNGKYYKVADGIDKFVLNAVDGMSKSEAVAYFENTANTPNKWHLYSTYETNTIRTVPFSGHFDGNGATIVGLYCKGDYHAHLGFIPYVENQDVTVENVKFQNAYIYSEDTRGEFGSAVVIGTYKTNTATNIKINNVSVVNSTVRDYNAAAIMGYAQVLANVAPRCQISNIVTANNTITCNATTDAAARHGVVFGLYSFWAGNTTTQLSNMILADNVQFASNAEALGNSTVYPYVSFRNLYTVGAKPADYAYTGATFGVNVENLKGAAAITTANALGWGSDFVAVADSIPDLAVFHNIKCVAVGEQGHFYKCTGEDCTVIPMDMDEHSYVNITCTVCGYTRGDGSTTLIDSANTDSFKADDWSTVADESAIGGSYLVGAPGDALEVTFDGSYAWITGGMYSRNTVLSVSVDGGEAETVTFNSSDIAASSEDNLNYWNGKKAAFLGDSITQGLYTPTTGGAHQTTPVKYCDIVGRAFGLGIYNYGIAGTTIAVQPADPADTAFSNRYVNMIDNADLVCVLGGVNDFDCDVELGTPESTDQNTFYGALNILCEGLKQKYSGKTIVFITPIYFVRTVNENGNTLQEFRNAITEIAGEKYGFYVVDGLSLGLDENTPNLSQHLFDGLHPNPSGHEIVGEKLTEILLNNISTKKDACIFETDTLSDGEHTIKVEVVSGSARIDGLYALSNGEEGTLQFEQDTYTVGEDSYFDVKVVRKGGSKGTLTAIVQDKTGLTENTVVTFADGETEKTVTLHTDRNSEAAGTLDFTLELVANGDNKLVTCIKNTATISIVDSEHEHDYTDGVVEALCTAKDDISYKHCDICDKYLIGDELVDELPAAPDHDYIDGAVESNCEAKEDIAYSYCDACDKYLIGDELVDELPAAPDHEYVDGTCECGDREVVADGWVDNADGTWSYYKDGVLIKSNWLNLGTWYYFDANGIMCTGWKQVGGTWYYFASSGAMQTGWVNDRGTWYYCDANGAMQTGWLKDGGTWYYLNADGVMCTGWKQVSGTWYYFASSGAMQTGWKQVSGTWYYFASSGAMQTGWQQVGGTWYYFASSGAMQTGWKQVSGTWYYFASSGAMQTGWQQVGGTWYYFASSGAMHTGWLNLGGTWYYMYSSGAMATNIYISGGYINSSGIWS